jgi:uncharacterized protein (DUF1330 family)
MIRIPTRRTASLLAAFVGASLATPFPVHAAGSKGYVVNEIQVTDAAKYKEYADQVPATLLPFGGTYLVKGGTVDVIGGTPPAGRVVILEFPSLAQAKAWHESAAYQKILVIRNASSTSRVYAVDGAPP